MGVKIPILLGFGELVNGIGGLPTTHLHSVRQGKRSCSMVPCNTHIDGETCRLMPGAYTFLHSRDGKGQIFSSLHLAWCVPFG